MEGAGSRLSLWPLLAVLLVIVIYTRRGAVARKHACMYTHTGRGVGNKYAIFPLRNDEYISAVAVWYGCFYMWGRWPCCFV